ncbi:MAG TPA: hypothetical protein PL185_12660 [Flavobacteriales bacterium]|nr:hypothetical protein [Flavobacteriales bacterium]
MGIFRIQGQPKRKWYILVVILVLVGMGFIWLNKFNRESPKSSTGEISDIEKYLIQEIQLNPRQVAELNRVREETDSLRTQLEKNIQVEQTRMEAEMKLKTHDAQVIKHANTITAYEVLLNKLNREQTNKLELFLSKEQLDKLSGMTWELAHYFHPKK